MPLTEEQKQHLYDKLISLKTKSQVQSLRCSR